MWSLKHACADPQYSQRCDLLKLFLVAYILWANCDGSGKTVHVGRLPERSLFAFVMCTLFTWAGSVSLGKRINEPPHDKTNKMTCVSSKDRPVWSVFAARMKKHWALNYLLRAQWRLIRLDWSVQSDQSSLMPRLIWVFTGHICHFVGFVVRRLKCICRQLNMCKLDYKDVGRHTKLSVQHWDR